MGIAATDVIHDFGAYYLNQGQNQNRIIKLLTQPSVTESYFTPIKTDDTIYRLSNMYLDKILQGFQKAWTPKGNATFIPNQIPVYHFKVDEELYPDDIEATWLGFLANSDIDRINWPLVKYLVENYYLPKIQEDYENYEVFKGIATEVTPGEASETGKTMNGIEQLLIQGINEGNHGHKMNKVALGTITTTNIFDKMEEFVDAFAPIYKTKAMNIFASSEIALAYNRNRRDKNFFNPESKGNAIDFLPQTIIPLPSMAGSSVIFASPKENILAIGKKTENMNKILITSGSNPRIAQFTTDFYKGIGFGINDVVWAYVPESILNPISGSGS